MGYKMCLYLDTLAHFSVCSLQENKTSTQLAVEEYDDLYKELYDDVSLSTVTVGPNVTEYEVG